MWLDKITWYVNFLHILSSLKLASDFMCMLEVSFMYVLLGDLWVWICTEILLS